MPTRATTYDYEQSSESGRERHIRVPYSRQTDATPILHNPVEITSLLAGGSLCGTSVSLDAVTSESIVNVAVGAIYRHGVRNCTGYAGGGAENAWAVINVGDPVYYDPLQLALSGDYLSISPFGAGGAGANSRFGIVVMQQDETADDFPKTDGLTPGTSVVLAVMQTGIIES